MQNIKNENLYWIGNKSVTIDAFHYFKKYASYALTVNTPIIFLPKRSLHKLPANQAAIA